MIRRYGWWALIAVLALAIGAGWYTARRARSQTPQTITGPNILQNNDFSLNQDDQADLPDGWSRNTNDVRLTAFGFTPGGSSVLIQGVNNYLRSPFVAAQPGAHYRVALRALGDRQATQARILFHYRDADGIDVRVTPGAWQPVPGQQWSVIQATDTAPEGATQVAISIRVASDDPIYVTDVNMGQLGVRINPWPNGKAAALAFSFDYETAMGGLIHSKSAAEDPNAAEPDWRVRAQRMRQGADQALRLFAPHTIRATFYTNGYNFLDGNPQCTKYMGNPTYAWANQSAGHNWQIDWGRKPWFGDDPCSTEAQQPEWYFGSQVDGLKAAQQDIQSHTFAHFSGTYVTPNDWQADFAAWHDVAKDRGVATPSSLAFPWSSSAGMPYASWDVLEQQGIRSVTRTTVSAGQKRSFLADREHWALRRVPNHTIDVIGDAYLTPTSRDQVLQQLQTALLNEGAIDVWAHTEEVTSADQIAAWQAAIDHAMRSFWVAPVPEIVQYAEDVKQVRIELQTEAPEYRFVVRNASDRALNGASLTLPFAPDQITVDGASVQPDGTSLILDLPRGAAREVVLFGAATNGVTPHEGAAWRN